MYTSKKQEHQHKKQVTATQLKRSESSGKTLEDNRATSETAQLVTQLAHKRGKRKSTQEKHQKGERQLQDAQIQARWRQLYNSNFSKGTPFCKNWIKKNRQQHGENYSQWTRQKM
ncbi:hypothetical protein C8N46_101678 [Kordia periserrulae]|uniref:Uncharacterized protein n=1 Tax=Kordia periserrulae TaxID=701523 RepID=A0A2T6C6W9_9FLAO|nr:hypothetical protein [Kordia periserrulae]PTX64068.1 hypothetical protein C8N46_101678 [Kordia periserrulae]